MQFRILGPVEVTNDGGALALGPPKQRAVLAALLLDPNRVVSVDRFVDLLWPEDPTPSTGSLPVYVANLRRLLEPDRPARTPPRRLLTRAPGYLLRVESGELDALDFEALAAAARRYLAEARPAAARAALVGALALWRGPVLEAFPFAAPEAFRLDALRLAALEDRLDADLALGAHTAVAAELESLVKEHPLRERLVGLLVLALYRDGRQGEALRALTAARTHLREELGIDPGPQLRRLEADVLAQAPELDWRPPPGEVEALPPPAPPVLAPDPAPSPFVGRAPELSAVDAALAALEQRVGAVVLVSGEPGIGKTRLAAEAATRAAARGATVVWGRCEEGEGAPPFWPWIQVVRALLATPDRGAVGAAFGPHAAVVAQLVPEVGNVLADVPGEPPPLGPAAARFRLFDAVAGALEELAARRALTIVLDDLHWADSPSIELTAHVAARLDRTAAVLVVTYRDVDPAPHARLAAALARLARHPRRVDLPLAGLSEDEVAQFMAAQAGSAPSPGAVAAVWARAGGNPFFVGELTRLLVSERALTEPEPAAAGAVPWAVRQVVERRVARLPAAARRLLTVAGVAGKEFDLRAVAGAAGVDVDRALDLIDPAIAAGLVAEQPEAGPERFTFCHALAQETVYQSVPGLRRCRLHGLLADALEAQGGDQAAAAEVAHHRYRAVAVTGPVPAVAAALRASAAAQGALAHEVAEDHLRRALALVDGMAPGRARDRLELDVQDHLAALLTLTRGVADPETAGAWARAAALCHEVEDRRRLFPSLWGTFSFAWASGDLDGAVAMAHHIGRLGQASAEPVVDAAAGLGLGAVALCRGDLAPGEAHLRAAKAVADAQPEPTLAEVTYADIRVQLDSWLSMALHLRGEHDEGRAVADRAMGRARARGDTFTVAIGLAFGVFARVLSEEGEEALVLAEELAEHARRHQLVDFVFHAEVARAWATARASPGEEAARLAGQLPPATAAGIRPWRPFWLLLLAEAWQALDRPDDARCAVQEGLDEVAAMGASFCAPALRRLRAELGGGG
jgi:DNA-binding SARP family transcriptional activator